MKSYVFKVVIEPDTYADGRPAFMAYCPALPGTTTWGDSVEEALRNVHEAAEMVLEDMIEHGELLPEASLDGVTTINEPVVSVTVPS